MLRIKIPTILILLMVLLLSSCVTVTDGGADYEKASKINVQLGIGYYNRGNLELANQKLLKAMKQDPKSSQAHHAYAVLQNRFLDKAKAEEYFKKAISLDPENSEALNNYGVFLCADNRILEAEKMFMQAVDNDSYRSPEVAYTSAAICLLKEGESKQPQAKEYLKRALAIGNNYRPALFNMAKITLAEQNYELTGVYLNRFHLTGEETSQSLWLNIQNELAQGHIAKVNELVENLKTKFPDSEEYKQWLESNK